MIGLSGGPTARREHAGRLTSTQGSSPCSGNRDTRGFFCSHVSLPDSFCFVVRVLWTPCKRS